MQTFAFKLFFDVLINLLIDLSAYVVTKFPGTETRLLKQAMAEKLQEVSKAGFEENSTTATASTGKHDSEDDFNNIIDWNWHF